MRREFGNIGDQQQLLGKLGYTWTPIKRTVFQLLALRELHFSKS
jgi:hypothetical protein